MRRVPLLVVAALVAGAAASSVISDVKCPDKCSDEVKTLYRTCVDALAAYHQCEIKDLACSCFTLGGFGNVIGGAWITVPGMPVPAMPVPLETEMDVACQHVYKCLVRPETLHRECLNSDQVACTCVTRKSPTRGLNVGAH